jgi:hypothetical protein
MIVKTMIFFRTPANRRQGMEPIKIESLKVFRAKTCTFIL